MQNQFTFPSISSYDMSSNFLLECAHRDNCEKQEYLMITKENHINTLEVPEKQGSPRESPHVRCGNEKERGHPEP